MPLVEAHLDRGVEEVEFIVVEGTVEFVVDVVVVEGFPAFDFGDGGIERQEGVVEIGLDCT